MPHATEEEYYATLAQAKEEVQAKYPTLWAKMERYLGGRSELHTESNREAYFAISELVGIRFTELHEGR